MEVSETRSNRYADQTEEMGLHRTHVKEVTIQQHTPGPNLEPKGQERDDVLETPVGKIRSQN
jgi:hypothetical protein